MNIVFITSIGAIVVFFAVLLLSIVKPRDIRYQLIYIIAGSFALGVIVSIILINYSGKSALIWPGIFMVHVVNKTREIVQQFT